MSVGSEKASFLTPKRKEGMLRLPTQVCLSWKARFLWASVAICHPREWSICSSSLSVAAQRDKCGKLPLQADPLKNVKQGIHHSTTVFKLNLKGVRESSSKATANYS